MAEICYLSRAQNSEVIGREAVDFDGLKTILSKPTLGGKNGKGWMPVSLNGDTRKREAVAAVHFLVLDVERKTDKVKDGNGKNLLDEYRDEVKEVSPDAIEPPSVDQMLEKLAAKQLKAIIHTSYSHSLEHPRYRLIFELSRPLAKDEVKPLGEAIASTLELDASSYDQSALEPARFFFLPRCPSNERLALFRCEMSDGQPLNVDAMLHKPLPSGGFFDGVNTQANSYEYTTPANGLNSNEYEQRISDLADALEFISSDDYGEWVRIGQCLHGLGADGFNLWLDWSQKSQKFDHTEAVKKWATFTGDNAGYQGVFSAAQAQGWTNSATLRKESRKAQQQAQQAHAQALAHNFSLAKGDEAPASASELPADTGEFNRKLKLELKTASLNITNALLRAGKVELIEGFNGALTPLLEKLSNATQEEKGSDVLTFSELLKLPPLPYLIRNLLPAKGLGLLIGKSGGGKTFLALLLAAMLSQGRNFLGKPTKQTNVFYMGLEGGAGIKNRMLAISKQHNLPPDSLENGLAFKIAGGFSLLEPMQCLELAQTVLKKTGKGSLVIIDTLNQAAAGADENSPKDMGEIIAGLQLIQSITSGLVLAVHHLGKDASRGARGHSSLYAACDVVLAATKEYDQSDGKLTTDAQHGGKAKDAEPVTTSYTLKSVDLGLTDEEGLPITSAIAELSLRETSGGVELTAAREKTLEKGYIECLNNGLAKFDSKGRFLGIEQKPIKEAFIRLANVPIQEGRTKQASYSTAYSQAFSRINQKEGVLLKNQLNKVDYFALWTARTEPLIDFLTIKNREKNQEDGLTTKSP